LKTTVAVLFIVAASSALTTTAFAGGLANACAGDQYFGSLPNPGAPFSTLTNQYITCQTTSGVQVTVSNSGTDTVEGTPYGYSNTATASAGFGFIKVSGSNTGEAIVPFPGAAAYAGFSDTMTITGGTGSAVWVVPVLVKGTLDADENGALTRLGIDALENGDFLTPYDTTLNAFAYSTFLTDNGGSSGIENSVIGFSWDYQGAWYGAVNYGPSSPDTVASYTLDQVLYFAFPFTYGTTFEFGIYMGGVAGEYSSGCCGDLTPNTTSFDFAHTLTWDGPGEVINQSDQVNPNFTLTSGSGFNYSQAYEETPEPATGCGLLMGLGVLGWFKRRHS